MSASSGKVLFDDYDTEIEILDDNYVIDSLRNLEEPSSSDISMEKLRHSNGASSKYSRVSLRSFEMDNKTPSNSKDAIEYLLGDTILCVGNCTLDIVHICKEFPTENGKQVVSGGYWQRGGNACNNCTVLRNLGASCEFIGMMSSLPSFSFLREDCIKRGIRIQNCPLVDKIPPFSSVLACNISGTYTIVQTNLGFPILKFKHFREINLRLYSWIHFEGRNTDETKLMINMIRKFNNEDTEKITCPIYISLQLAKCDKSLLSLALRVNLIFVGREFALHMGWSTPKETVHNLSILISAMQLREEKEYDEMEICFRSPHIVCPWGSDGCSLLSSSCEYYYIPGAKVGRIVDAKGSGDTFVATIIYAMNNLKMEFKKAVQLGCHVAVYKMQHIGLDCVADIYLDDFKIPKRDINLDEYKIKLKKKKFN